MLQVTTPRPAPKELEDDARSQPATKGRAQLDTVKPSEPAPAPEPVASKATAGKRAVAPVAPAATRAPDAAAPSPSTAPATVMQGNARSGGAPGGGVVGGAAGAGAEDKADGDLAWAREQHSRLVVQVRAGRCTEAAGTAVALSSRAPGYYQQNVEGDRAVKDCLAYINAERERAAERAQRARAATARRASDEAAAPATGSKAAAPKKAAKPAADKSDAAKTSTTK
jgi:hypothetical protein